MIEINRNQIRQTGKTEGAWRIQWCSHGTERARRRRWSPVREGPHAGTDTATRQRRHAPAHSRGACRIFAERGVDRATGKEITEAAGVNVAEINHHFGGAAALYGEVLVM